MIIEALVAIFRTVALSVLNLLPAGNAEPINVSGLLVPGTIADAVFPWTHAVAAAAFMLGWMVVVHGYRLVLFLLGVIHISGETT